MILSTYLSRLFLTRTLAALLAFAALLQLLDLLDSASTVLARGGGGLDLLYYAVLRLPLILERVIPLSVLIGSLVTLWSLAQHNEITAFRASGMTPYKLVATLMPAALVIAATHFLISDQVAPRTERAFLDWWASTAPDDTGAEAKAPGRIWMRVGDAVVAVDKVVDNGRVLEGVEVFPRDTLRRVTGRIQAARATYSEGRWTLHDGQRLDAGNGPARTDSFGQAPWDVVLTPANILDVANPPENLSRSRLRNILRGAWSGTQSPSYYRTRLYASYAGPLASLTMVLLAAPVAHGMRRRGTLSGGLTLGLVSGLLFLVVNGLMMALGEASVVPAMLAAWGPTVLFAAFAGAVLVHIEG